MIRIRRKIRDLISIPLCWNKKLNIKLADPTYQQGSNPDEFELSPIHNLVL